MPASTATGAQGQGSGAAEPQGGTAQPDQGQAGSEEAFDKDRALATIQRQRDSEAEAKRQLAEAVRRAEAAESERDSIKATTLTESEKAIAKARKDGVTETQARFQAQLRRSGVKAALAAAGVGAELLDLATKDDVFAELKVNDDGEIEGLDGAITALRKARPSLFSKPVDFGGGQRGATPETPTDMNTLFRRASGH